jgi:hypothetical protein
VGNKIWLQLNKERLQGPGKKIKALRYGPFEVLEKVGDNAYRLSLPPYMRIYSVVNVENLKLYELSMLDQEEEQVLPSIEGLAPNAHAELAKDIVLQNKYKTTRQGQHSHWQIELKLERTISKQRKMVLHGKGRGKIFSPHSVNLLGTKSLLKWGGMIQIGSLYYLSSISMLSEWKILEESTCRVILVAGPFWKIGVWNLPEPF